MNKLNDNLPTGHKHQLTTTGLLLLMLICIGVATQSILYAYSATTNQANPELQEAKAHELQLEHSADSSMSSANYNQACDLYNQAIDEFEHVRNNNLLDDNRQENLQANSQIALRHASPAKLEALQTVNTTELTPAIAELNNTLRLIGSTPKNNDQAADMVKIHVIIGDYLHKLKRYTEAKAEYTTALVIANDWQLDQSKDAETYFSLYKGLGKACHQSNDLKLAVDYLTKAIDIRLKLVGEQNELCLAYLELELSEVLKAQGLGQQSFAYLEKSYNRMNGAFQWIKGQSTIADFTLGETAVEMYRHYARRADAMNCEMVLNYGLVRLSTLTQQYLYNTQGFALPKAGSAKHFFGW